MVQPIAIVRLAPGEVGYYDPYTKIHLTLSRKEATVYNYMNTSRLKTAIADRILILKAGSLNSINYFNKSDSVPSKYIEVESFSPKKETAPEVVVEPEAKKQIPVEVEKEAAKKETKTAPTKTVETKKEEVELTTGEEKAKK